MTKQEFHVLAMLYAALIDGNIHENEVEEILQKTDPSTLRKMKKKFREMSDADILSLIQDSKKTFIANEKAKQDFLDDIHSVLIADGRFLSIESYLLKTLEKIIE